MDANLKKRLFSGFVFGKEVEVSQPASKRGKQGIRGMAVDTSDRGQGGNQVQRWGIEDESLEYHVLKATIWHEGDHLSWPILPHVGTRGTICRLSRLQAYRNTEFARFDKNNKSQMIWKVKLDE